MPSPRPLLGSRPPISPSDLDRSRQVLLLLASHLHPAFARLWANHIPKLLDYLRASAPHLCGIDTAGGGGAGAPSAANGSAVVVGGGGGRLSDEWAQLTLHFLGDTLDVRAASARHHLCWLTMAPAFRWPPLACRRCPLAVSTCPL